MPVTDNHFGKNIRAVIFDLDGTLIDTEPAAAKAITESFQGWGIQVDHDDAAYITGRTWETAFQFLFKKYEIPVPAQQASQEMISRYRELIEKQLFPVAGSAEAVRALAKDYPLAHFQVILGAEDYPRSKPAPDGYLKALDLLNMKAENTLVFEDSEAGITSAKSAGTFVAAITGTNHFRQNTAHAHVFLKDLIGVDPNWVRALKILA
jgi:HAD superfamily hydrolase (TIGR01509 family)